MRRRRELPRGRMRGGCEEKLSKISPVRARKTELEIQYGCEVA